MVAVLGAGSDALPTRRNSPTQQCSIGLPILPHARLGASGTLRLELRAMMAYLRARWNEWSTRGAVLCLLAICAWVIWRWHVEIWHILAASIAAIIASVPSRALTVVWCIAKKMFTKPATEPSTTPRETSVARPKLSGPISPPFGRSSKPTRPSPDSRRRSSLPARCSGSAPM